MGARTWRTRPSTRWIWKRARWWRSRWRPAMRATRRRCWRPCRRLASTSPRWRARPTTPKSVSACSLQGPVEAVADKGYHSNDTLVALQEAEVRTYISEPDRGRRRWQDKAEARQAVYDNRRRIQGERGKQLLRRRGELLERSFAHAYETGGLRRVYLRGRENVSKRVLIHLGGFNLSLVMRQWLGKGTPRGWQGYSADAVLMWLRICMTILAHASDTVVFPSPKTPAPVPQVTVFILPTAR